MQPHEHQIIRKKDVGFGIVYKINHFPYGDFVSVLFIATKEISKPVNFNDLKEPEWKLYGADSLLCPICNAPLDSEDSTCDVCGYSKSGTDLVEKAKEFESKFLKMNSRSEEVRAIKQYFFRMTEEEVKSKMKNLVTILYQNNPSIKHQETLDHFKQADLFAKGCDDVTIPGTVISIYEYDRMLDYSGHNMYERAVQYFQEVYHFKNAETVRLLLNNRCIREKEITEVLLERKMSPQTLDEIVSMPGRTLETKFLHYKEQFGLKGVKVLNTTRVTHCRNCKTHLDGYFDICPKCGGIICPVCGACLCDYKGGVNDV